MHLLRHLAAVQAEANELGDPGGSDGGAEDRYREIRSGDGRDLSDDLAKDLSDNQPLDANFRLDEQARVGANTEGSMKEDGRLVLVVEEHLEFAACDGGDVDELAALHQGLMKEYVLKLVPWKKWIAIVIQKVNTAKAGNLVNPHSNAEAAESNFC